MAKFTKTALIVFAHQEPKSFNGALRDTAEQTLMKLGFTVEISDLYAQEFDARATKHDFTGKPYLLYYWRVHCHDIIYCQEMK